MRVILIQLINDNNDKNLIPSEINLFFGNLEIMTSQSMFDREYAMRSAVLEIDKLLLLDLGFKTANHHRYADC